MRLILGAVVSVMFLWPGYGSGHIHPTGDACHSDMSALAAFETELHRKIPRCELPTRLAPKLNEILLSMPSLSAESQALLENGASPIMATKEIIEVWAEAYADHIKKYNLRDATEKKLLEALNKAKLDLSAKAPNANMWETHDPLGPLNIHTPEAAPYETLKEKLDAYLDKAAFQNCVKHTVHLFIVSNIINAGGAVLVHWKDYAGKDAKLLENFFDRNFYLRIIRDERFVQNASWNGVFMAGYGALACLRNQTVGYWGLVGFAAVSAILGQLPTGISWRQTITNVAYISTVSYWKGRAALSAVEWYQSRDYPFPKTVETLIWTANEAIGAVVYPPWDDYTRHLCTDPAKPTSGGG